MKEIKLENLCASIEEKKRKILELFDGCTTSEKLYQKLIELGKNQSKLADNQKNSRTKVSGCQSQIYLVATLEKGKVFFKAESDALISAGLAFLLTSVYSDDVPEALFKCPPDHIEKLNLSDALTPGRSSGLRSIFLKMQQEALLLLSSKKPQDN